MNDDLYLGKIGVFRSPKKKPENDENSFGLMRKL